MAGVGLIECGQKLVIENRFNISGYLVFTGCGDGNIRSYDPRTGELMRTYRGHRGPVNCMVIIGDRMYSGSTDGTLRRSVDIFSFSPHLLYLSNYCYKDGI